MSPGYSYLGYVNSNEEYIGLAYGSILRNICSYFY